MQKVYSFINSVLFLFLVASISAQVNPDQLIPTDPKVTKGTLPNGLTYYIKENKKPEKKVELRLVVKVGSIVEDDDQQGLAHMAEHMAFNGTKNFKKNEIVSFLQDIGVEFGSDLNAYTGFDETVYILPIPTDKPDNLEKGFQILEDWAHQVTYLDEDINSERGIILEESRLGKSGEERMFKKVYPELFKGSKYAKRLPIGIDSIIKNFNPDAIRRFYKDWYRPDLMSVVVVGDISKEDAMKMINKHFAALKNPASPRNRAYADVPPYSDNKAMVVTDKEATNIEFSINYPAFPEKKSGTFGEYRNDLLRSLYTSMLGVRLRELTQKENPPFVYAFAGFGSYAKNYNSFSIQGSTGTQDVQKGIDAALTELERVKRFGFTAAELDRANKNMLNSYENSFNNRDKTESSVFADEYIRNFTDNESIPGIAVEFEQVKTMLPSITLDEVNGVAAVFKNEKNRFSYVMGPEASSTNMLPSPDGIVAMLDAKANDNTIKPYEEKVIASNLLTKMPATGKVISSKKNALLGTTELVLSNGIQVKLKVTDFKNDQILIGASRFGGLTNYSLQDKYSAENAATMVASMGIGAFNPTDLKKSLAGKTVSLSPVISNYYSGFSGSSVKKDIETLFQLLTLYVTEPRKDTVLFKSVIQRGKAQVAMLGANPQFAFIDTLYKVLYNNNPLAPTAVPKVDNYDKIDLDRCMAIYKERLGDLGGMHISIVGSFDEKEIITLLEKYVAGLPAKSPATFVDNKLRPFIGENNFQFKRGKEDKSLILGILHGESTYSEATSLKLNALSDAMNILITEEMREKIQGIYGGGTNVSYEKIPYGRYQFVLQLPCGPNKVDTLIGAFKHELTSIAEKGIDQSYVDKVKKAWIEKYKVDVKSNEYWLSSLQGINRGEKSEDRVLNAEKYYEKLAAADIKEAAIMIQKSKGKMIAVQMPEVVK
jgi:zinc protease